MEAIRHDLACPVCGYNLRGLRGDTVQCPECGLVCDVAKLVAARWDKPWHKAPGLNRLVGPVAIATIGLFVLGLVSLGIPDSQLQTGGAYLLGLLWLALLAWWLWALSATRRLFDAGWQGIGLSLLGHVIFVAYVVAVLMLIGGGFGTVAMVFTGGSGAGAGLLVAGLNVVIGASLFWLGRRGEKFIAARCIRQYLRNRARGAPAMPE